MATVMYKPAQFPAAIRNIGAVEGDITNDSIVVTGEDKLSDTTVTISGLSDMATITGIYIYDIQSKSFGNPDTPEVMCVANTEKLALTSGGTATLKLIYGSQARATSQQPYYDKVHETTIAASFDGSTLTVSGSRDFYEINYIIIGTPKSSVTPTHAAIYGTSTSATINELAGFSKITAVCIIPTDVPYEGLFYACRYGMTLTPGGTDSVPTMEGKEKTVNMQTNMCDLQPSSATAAYNGSSLTLTTNYAFSNIAYVIVGETASGSGSSETYEGVSGLFTAIADAIREKGGATGTLKPAQFPAAIRSIGAVEGADVSVMGSVTPSSSGSMVISGLSSLSTITKIYFHSNQGQTNSSLSTNYISYATAGTSLSSGGSTTIVSYAFTEHSYKYVEMTSISLTASFDGSSLTLTPQSTAEWQGTYYYTVVGTGSSNNSVVTTGTIAVSSDGLTATISGLASGALITGIFVTGGNNSPEGNEDSLVNVFLMPCALSSGGTIRPAALTGSGEGVDYIKDYGAKFQITSSYISASFNGSTLTLTSSASYYPFTSGMTYFVVQEFASNDTSSTSYDKLSELFADIAAAIREKTNSGSDSGGDDSGGDDSGDTTLTWYVDKNSTGTKEVDMATIAYKGLTYENGALTGVDGEEMESIQSTDKDCYISVSKSEVASGWGYVYKVEPDTYQYTGKAYYYPVVVA